MARNGNFAVIEPFRKFTPVTPSDSTVLAFDALFIGVSGDVAIVDAAGNTVTLKNLQQGLIYPISGTKVMATNTTATNMFMCVQ